MNEEPEEFQFRPFGEVLLDTQCRVSDQLRGDMIFARFDRTSLSRIGTVSLVMTDLAFCLLAVSCVGSWEV